MASERATGREFTAPAGALTLLLAGGWSDREALLDLLYSSRDEGLGPLIERRIRATGPGPVRPAERTPPAEAAQLQFVAGTLERWLGDHPGGPLELGPPGVEAIAAMACCWSAAVTHALANEPHDVTELRQAVPALHGEGVVREHAEALVRSGQAEVAPGSGGRYALTDWGREAIAPIVAAVRYERHYPEEDVLAPEVLDAEGAFRLALPLVTLPPDLQGTCRLGVEIPGDDPLMAGATAEVRDGRVVASSPLLEREPETWATGTPLQWCEAVIDPTAVRLEAGGDTRLAGALLEGLHESLFLAEAI